MKIVVLDTMPLNPGDLSWDSLEALGELVLYENTAPEEVAKRIEDAEAIFSNKVTVNSAAISQAKNLRYIGVTATGYNNIDVDAATERQIPVCNVPGYGTTAVAQATIAMLLCCTNHVHHHHLDVQDGKWQESESFSFWTKPLVELSGKNLCIIGYGDIGKNVAAIANMLGMNIIIAQIPGRPESPDKTELLEALAMADVVSLHCPLSEMTDKLINAETLKHFKKSAILLNTGRGDLVHEQELADALNNDELAAYAGDVLSSEPPAADNPLLSAKNCIITPHQAWATKESRQRLLDMTVENLSSFINGTAINCVNL
ncbi:MAG: D-2-hydroxyacid dehydrogenase [Lentisphaeria bacterium]|nr:D-2-hydroxyacid dehydrogenase [Lentisphaeria bacterium]NQZ68999.1 D-2-hydroxyacid dehydrogenase [Lentisphaeria bacterium]